MDDTMIVDCDRCEVRGNACDDCVISVLLGAPPEVEWDDEEQRAVDALVEGGVLPRLRLVPAAVSEPDAPRRPVRRAG